MTNNSTLSNWSNRVSPTAFITDGSGGVPYEDMIELCNEAQKDMWINVPALATPAFVQNLAQLIDADLDPNLNVYVEYSNETWNTAFRPVRAGARRRAGQPAGDPDPRINRRWSAQQSAYEEVSDRARSSTRSSGRSAAGPADHGGAGGLVADRELASSSSSSRITGRRRSSSTRRPWPPTSGSPAATMSPA